MAFSDDGKTNWTISSSSTLFTQRCNCIVYANNLWVVAGGKTNTLAYSTDGKNWSGIGNTTITNIAYCVAYANNLWVAGGNSGTGNNLAYSTDGKTWVISTNSYIIQTVYTVAYGNNLWIAGGGGTFTLAYSLDGKKNWTGIQSNPFTINYFIYTNNSWISGGDNNLSYSTNGTTWTGGESSNNSNSVRCIAYKGPLLTGCKLITCTSTGYTGSPGLCSCDTVSSYTGTVTYTNGILGGCDIIITTVPKTIYINSNIAMIAPFPLNKTFNFIPNKITIEPVSTSTTLLSSNGVYISRFSLDNTVFTSITNRNFPLTITSIPKPITTMFSSFILEFGTTNSGQNKSIPNIAFKFTFS